MTSCIHNLNPDVVVAPLAPRLSLRAVFETMFLWLALARSRRDLASLDDRALRDVGIDRATAAEEASKPFWQSY